MTKIISIQPGKLVFTFEHVGEFTHNNKYSRRVAWDFYTEESKLKHKLKEEKGYAYMLQEVSEDSSKTVYVGQTERGLISRMIAHAEMSNIYKRILKSVKSGNKILIFKCIDMHGFNSKKVEAIVIGRLLEAGAGLWNEFEYKEAK